MDIHQLILTKYLFDQGVSTLDNDNAMACGLAISLFQDSVELLCWTIAKEVDAPVKGKDSFEQIWDSVKSASKNKGAIELPLKAKMIEMNKARVLFKRYGNLPNPLDATKFMGFTEEFLQQAIEQFYNLQFDDISLADLVKNNSVRDKIKLAEKHFSDEKYSDCIRECAEAEYLISIDLHKILPKFDRNFEGIANLFFTSVHPGANSSRSGKSRTGTRSRAGTSARHGRRG